jgi:hypothetical protein
MTWFRGRQHTIWDSKGWIERHDYFFKKPEGKHYPINIDKSDFHFYYNPRTRAFLLTMNNIQTITWLYHGAPFVPELIRQIEQYAKSLGAITIYVTIHNIHQWIARDISADLLRRYGQRYQYDMTTEKDTKGQLVYVFIKTIT